MWNFEPCHAASGMELLDNMLIHFASLYISLSILDVHLLAANCQTRVIESSALVCKTWCTGSPRKIQNPATSARRRKQGQNWWPRCSQAYNQFSEGVADRN